MFYAGKQIGAYKLVKVLGRGGFGEVWLAEKQAKFVTTKVAVKFPLDEQIDVESIREEAVLWEQASGHPNVLPILDADEYDGQIVIVSEYASDGTLDELLRKRGALPFKRAVEITLGILSGLEYLHNKNIIHRDIKPANILLQGETPRLADFGLSRAMRGNSMSVNVNGTPYYMAPEAFSRKRNRQTDIWSVGVVLYKMLTGNLPFQAESPVDLMSEILVRQPDELPAHIPSQLNDIIHKALAKLPDNRYRNAFEMREDLANFLSLISYENLLADKASVDSKTTVGAVASPDKHQANRNLNYSFLDSEKLNAELDTDAGVSRVTAAPVKIQAERLAKKGFSLKTLRLHRWPVVAAATIILALIGVVGFPYIFRPPLIPYRQGDKFGFSKINRKIVIGARYDTARPFSENRALVGVGSRDTSGNSQQKYGFLDEIGREVVPLEYDQAADFSQNLAMVGKVHVNGKLQFGFINDRGAEVVPLKYDEAQSFTAENLAAVRSGDKWGFINQLGAQIIASQFDAVGSFSEKYAAYRLGEKWGFIDESGKQMLPPVYEFAGDFSEGYAPVKKDGKSFFIDTTGKQIFPFKYDGAHRFSEHLAQATVHGKSGFINSQGAEVIPFIYADVPAVFSEGLAPVKLNNLSGYISRGGSIVIDFRYAEADSFKNGLARVKDQNGKEFYIRPDGTEFLEP